MKNINLYLVRHGQTEWNIKDQMQGSQNSPLTNDGVLGAKVTGKHLKNIPFMQAYSSTLQRAIETRNYIVDENDLTHSGVTIPKYELEGLSEMDFGIWEGQNTAKLKAEFPEFITFLTDPAHFDASVNKGEDYATVLKRLEKALKTIVDNAANDRGDILVVSHGTVLRLLLCVLTGGDWHKHRDESYFPRMLNTSISVVNYQQENKHSEGKFAVKYFNNVEHLK
ncbi:histidine phosphatase family protein [Orbaceae bacterium ESL0721]|nr:histidine phosphatase family protein [Orbaceae bacterium ESL0721]